MVNQRAAAIQKLLRIKSGQSFINIGKKEATVLLDLLEKIHIQAGRHLPDDYDEAVKTGVWPTHHEPAADGREAHSPTIQTEDVEDVDYEPEKQIL